MFDFFIEKVQLFGIDFPVWSFFAAGIGILLILIIIICAVKSGKKKKKLKAKELEKSYFFEKEPLKEDKADFAAYKTEVEKEPEPIIKDVPQEEVKAVKTADTAFEPKPIKETDIVNEPKAVKEPKAAKETDVSKEPKAAKENLTVKKVELKKPEPIVVKKIDAKEKTAENPIVRSRFIINQTNDGRFMFNLASGNSVKIAASESYNSRLTCLNGIEAVRNNALSPMEDRTVEGFTPLKNPKYEIFNDKNGNFYFYLKAGNGELILKSDAYATKAGCLKSIESVKTNAPIAQIKN